MSDHYERWNESDCVETFATKAADDFFPSETHHLENIISDVHSVLDIGCASGRFIELLHSLGGDPRFVGLDIGLANIENAKRLYPEVEFHHANALDFKFDETFDLVNATGVFQHEPNFEKLSQVMASLSNKYILFDVKFSNTPEHIVDINASYAGADENRLYFNILNIDRLTSHLSTIPGVLKISIFGYETPLNNRTHVPPNIKHVVSAGILLTLGNAGDQPIDIERDLPENLLEI